MPKTKFEFILDLLNNHSAHPVQRNRILELASKELKLTGSFEQRLQHLEQRLETLNTEQELDDLLSKKPTSGVILQSEQPLNSTLPSKYFDPGNTREFLFSYNQDPILRSTCHDIDADELERICNICNTPTYDYTKHLDKIIEAFTAHYKKTAPHGTKALILGYLTGKNHDGNAISYWSSDNIPLHWSHPEVKLWASQNPLIPPNCSERIAANAEVSLLRMHPQKVTSISMEPIQNFTQLVLHFKNMFHIRSGAQSLKSIIQRVNDKKWKSRIHFSFSSSFATNLEHFTDVDKLVQGYNQLIQIIVDSHTSEGIPKVLLNYEERNQTIRFSIHHLNSTYGKTAQNTLERLGTSYSNLIRSQVNGYCNLLLRADFGQNYFADLNIWNGKNPVLKPIEEFKGVEHIMEYPKFAIK